MIIFVEPDDNKIDEEPNVKEIPWGAGHATGDIEMQDQPSVPSKEEEIETLSSEQKSYQNLPKLSEVEVSDLCCDLGLSKWGSELLASRFEQ